MSWNRSPSLAHSGRENPEAVGQCFAECDQLPLLLARAVVGDDKRRTTLCAMRRLGVAFKEACTLAMREWMLMLREKQTRWIESGISSVANRNYEHLADMSAAMDGAFGKGFSQTYHENSLVCSTHNEKGYMAMFSRRCQICKGSMSPRRPSSPSMKQQNKTHPLFCFAHPSCQAKYTVVIRDRFPGVVERMRMGNSDTSDDEGPPHGHHYEIEGGVMHRQSTLRALVNEHPGFPKMPGRLRDICSNYVRHINPVDPSGRSPIVLWIGDHSVDTSAWVAWEDTLLGSLKISHEDVLRARSIVADKRRRAEQARAARSLSRKAELARKAVVREGELRLALGKHSTGLMWRTIEEVAAVDPTALEMTGCTDFINGGTHPVMMPIERLMHRLRYMQYVLHGVRDPLTPCTAAFFFNHHRLFNWSCPANIHAPYDTRLVRFLDNMDRMAPSSINAHYDITSVRRIDALLGRTAPFPMWRIQSTTYWNNGSVQVPRTHTVREDQLRLAEAKLRRCGASVLQFPAPPDGLATGSVAAAKANHSQMTKYVKTIVDSALTVSGHRLVAYDLLGLNSSGLENVIECFEMAGHAPAAGAAGPLVWHEDVSEGDMLDYEEDSDLEDVVEQAGPHFQVEPEEDW